MNLHKRSAEHSSAALSMTSTSSMTCGSRIGDSLSLKLMPKRGEQIDVLPQELMKKYIAYARKYVKPQLTQDAAQVVQEFFIELRQNRGCDISPVTTRQLESLIRFRVTRCGIF